MSIGQRARPIKAPVDNTNAYVAEYDINFLKRSEIAQEPRKIILTNQVSASSLLYVVSLASESTIGAEAIILVSIAMDMAKLNSANVAVACAMCWDIVV